VIIAAPEELLALINYVMNDELVAVSVGVGV
jgi:hypothetical protein